MKLLLEGHDRTYAVEQSLLNYFSPEAEGTALSRLSSGKQILTAITTIEKDGKRYRGCARAAAGTQPDTILKLSFYRAVRQMMDPPVWGALTGIRPAKKALQLQDEGQEPAAALQKRYDVAPAQALLAAECAEYTRTLRDKLTPGDISLYIGIPFCPTRCSYCSFISASAPAQLNLIPAYLERLSEEITLAGALLERLGLRVRTLYWGGGTPTTLSSEQLRHLLSVLRNSFDLSHLWEHTVEAGRPDTITEEKLLTLRAGGVTRLSINPQSLSDEVLRQIGRAHTAEMFESAFAQARALCPAVINTDLIAGLPADTPEGFAASLKRVISLAPDNITVHTLARKKGTRITEGTVAVQDTEPVRTMLDTASKALREGGYRPYYLYRQKFTSGGRENVGWTKPGREGLYNLCMMEELSSVLALGAGGVTKLVTPENNRIERFFHCKYPLEYLDRYDKIEGNRIALERHYTHPCY